MINRVDDALKLFEEAAGRLWLCKGVLHPWHHAQERIAWVSRDIKKSLEYLHKAAKQKPYYKFFVHGVVYPNPGVAHAENSIGTLYRDGLAVDQNDSVAFQWFLRSAQHGCSLGMNNLGLALQEGQGCTKNLN